MRERGEVVELEAGLMVLRFERQAACAGCKMCELSRQQTMLLRLNNTLNAQLGDWVEIVMEAKPIAPMVAYGLPMLGLLLGLGLGFFVGRTMGAVDVGAGVGGILGAGLGFLAIRILEPWSRKRLTPTAERIVGNSNNG